MNTYIALLRGINVGGKNTLPMKDLVDIFREFGYFDIRTYIQSGNVIFRSKTKCTNKTAMDIASGIKTRFGFEPKVWLISDSELRTAIENNPFSLKLGKHLHFSFLATKPKNPDLTKLAKLKSATEEFKLVGNVFYLFAPDGIGRSRLAASVERSLGVEATGRNFNTISKLISLLDANP